MSRKLLVTLILILFLFPFVSWYYLQRGLDWRKEAQEVMKGKEAFPSGEWMDQTTNKISTDQLEGKVTLVTFLNCDQIDDDKNLLNELYEQFKETGKAHFIILDSCRTDKLDDLSRQDWIVLSCSDSMNLCYLLSKNWPDDKSHALVDKDKHIRSYYASETEDEKRILLEHMALLLPRERSEKVELKRGNKK